MKRLPINLTNPNPRTIQTAAQIIKHGGVIVFPSDTVYGLAADATNPEAIKKLYSIKKMVTDKPISIIVHDEQMAKDYCQFNDLADDFFSRYLPGQITLILPRKKPLAIPGENPSIRIPGTPIINLLSKILNIPYTATSANIAGQPESYTPQQIIQYFNNTTYQPDLFLDAGALPTNQPSTVVDLTGKKPIVLRQGPVKIEE